jgi:hypothetical protein
MCFFWVCIEVFLGFEFLSVFLGSFRVFFSGFEFFEFQVHPRMKKNPHPNLVLYGSSVGSTRGCKNELEPTPIGSKTRRCPET